MTAAAFRALALALPEAIESAHMDHPDFRVRGKIFATLGYPDGAWGVVKFTPLQQAAFVRAAPDAFVPVKGAWGRRGATAVNLRKAAKPTARKALTVAWSNVAPKRLVRTALGVE